MLHTIGLFLASFLGLFRSRRSLWLENLALRQQLVILKRKRRRTRLTVFDKIFWVLARKYWSRWKQSLLMISPETIPRWHRAGFRLYWAWLSRHRVCFGRKRIGRDLRELIFRMVVENPMWGAPRIHGELQMLGFDVSERTVSRWVQRAPRSPDKIARWNAFLKNHREIIAAMDFFTVHTVTFGVLYCFFLIAHDRRRILHFNVTHNPTSLWVVQLLRETFPFEAPHKYMILDRDQKFGLEVIAAIRAMGSRPKRTSFRSPWQNGVAERWVESCRRDLLDHVIVLNERHLKRLLSEYVSYYHEDRTHLGLSKETPGGRIRAMHRGRVIAHARLGGLHHRYDRAS
jgi:putative transposase